MGFVMQKNSKKIERICENVTFLPLSYWQLISISCMMVVCVDKIVSISIHDINLPIDLSTQIEDKK